jgi:hypothetical protein
MWRCRAVTTNAAVYEDPAPVLPAAADGPIRTAGEHSAADAGLKNLTNSIAALEDEHGALKTLVRHTPLKAALRELRPTASFEESWNTPGLDKRVKFPILMEFSGGLASPFPATATVESDFSVVRWEDKGRRACRTSPSRASCSASS